MNPTRRFPCPSGTSDLVSPSTIKRTVGPRRPPNRDLRNREYLTQDEVERLILTVVRRNDLTCVMVSHDLAQAARVADRVMVMSKGRLAKIGAVNEVINAEGIFR